MSETKAERIRRLNKLVQKWMGTDLSESSLNGLLTDWQLEVDWLKTNVLDPKMNDGDRIFREGRIDALEDCIAELKEKMSC